MPGSFLSRLHSLAQSPGTILKVLIVVQLFIVLWQFFPQMSTNGDDAVYLVLGKALAQGQGYADISAPGSPGQALYPPALPALLALIDLISDTPLLPKAVVSFFALLITLLGYHYFRSRAPDMIFAVLTTMVISYQMAQFSVILMSEVPYLLFTMLALVLLDRSIARPNNALLFGATIAVSVLPIEARTIGISFSVAWIVAALWKRQFRYAVWHLAIVAVLIGGLRLMNGAGASYLGPLFMRNSYNPDLGMVTVPEMAHRIGTNFVKYVTEVVPATLLPLDPSRHRAWMPAAGIAIVAIASCGWIRLFRRTSALVALYLLLYAGILLLWQTEWSSERFIVPILPFVAFCVLLGIDALAVGGLRLWAIVRKVRGSSPSARRRAFLGAALPTVAVIGAVNIHAMAFFHAQNFHPTADWVNFCSCADWLRINTPRSAVVVSRKPELCYLRSKHQGLLYPFTHDVERVVDTFKKNKVQFIIFDNFFWTHTSAEYLYPVISSQPEHFKVVYALHNPDTFVLEFVP